jgi:hypothetical protein
MSLLTKAQWIRVQKAYAAMRGSAGQWHKVMKWCPHCKKQTLPGYRHECGECFKPYPKQ